MECNKDEAIRAKTISEDKFKNREYDGARKFAVKAQTLYPELEGIIKLIATIDVYISYEKKTGGEVEWYEVLKVDPSADDETVKKQYRKLALVLHPDKNHSVGADGAFKMVSEACNFLLDREKRLAYDQRRTLRGLQQKVSLHAQTAQYQSNGVHNYGSRTASASNDQASNRTAQSGSNGVHNLGNRTTQVPKPAAQSQPNGTSKAGSKTKGQSNGTNKATKRKPAQPSQKRDTFWTMCNQCKFHYEFVRMYINGTLLCDTCKKPFIAKETAPPPGYSASKVPGDNAHNQNAHGPGKSVPGAKKSGPDDSAKNAPAAKKPRQGPSSNHDLGKNVPSAANSGSGPNQIAHVPGKNAPSANRPELNQNIHCPEENVQAANKSASGQAGMKYVRNANQEKVPHSGTPKVGSRDHPTGAKAARVVQEVLNELKRARAEGNVPVGSQEQIKKSRLGDNSQKKMKSRVNGFSGPKNISPLDYPKIMMSKSQKDVIIKLNAWKSEEGDSTEKHDGKRNLSTNIAAEQMTVPDPDFHDFDNDRTERSFGDNEVWSAYDDKDGMPRLYALIHKVDSRKPFKLTISWLNSKTNAEFSSMDWVSSGFYKTCGEYWVGKYEPVKSINAFSQKVNFSKTKRGSVLIFPQKDEVWALYKNWSSGWDKHTPKDVVEKYDMVKVLDDYTEENGISVAPLVKVAGFKTVFRPDLDSHVIKRVPKEEMLRFSHRVPHHMLTCQEAQNAPKGCVELDPASTPLELLQVIAEAHEPVIPS